MLWSTVSTQCYQTELRDPLSLPRACWATCSSKRCQCQRRAALSSSETFEVLFLLAGFFPPALICDDKNTTELCSVNCISARLLNPSRMGIVLAAEGAAERPMSNLERWGKRYLSGKTMSEIESSGSSEPRTTLRPLRNTNSIFVCYHRTNNLRILSKILLVC